MIDAITGERLTVEGHADEEGGGTLVLPRSQVDAVTALLETYRIWSSANEEYVSPDKGTNYALITFSSKVHATLVQYLLDNH